MTMRSVCVVFLLTSLAARSAPLSIIADGKIRTTVVRPCHPAPDELAAAQDLAHNLELMTGDQAEIRPADCIAPDQPAFHVGQTGAPEIQFETLATLGPDAVRLRRVGARIFLCGATPRATRLAVSRFLQEEAGVCWFMPGELGAFIPAATNWTVGDLDRTFAPTFRSRSMAGLSTEAERTWALHNGLIPHLRLGHNLYRVFPPALFETRPDFFPMTAGRRAPPPPNNPDQWQPCFGNPDAAAYAANVAQAHFAKDPDLNSFSLAMNDNLLLCDCPLCRALIPNRLFRGMPDASDLVFTFVSRAAREVAADYPDRMITAYAYQWCENAPSFDLPPNVAVYLTADRSFWHDSAFRAEDEDLIRRWTQRCSWVGLYDYYYGVPFAVPRLFTASSAASLQFAASNHVAGFHAGLHPFWALDGPKAWLAAQLLWQVEQNPAALLDEYYEKFFQEAQAPMRQFYDLCEAQWQNQGGRVTWLKYFKSWRQFEIFPAAVRSQARELLDQAARHATNHLTRRRVAFVSTGFRVTEIYGRIVDLVEKLTRTNRPDIVLDSLKEIRAQRSDLTRLIAQSINEVPPAIPSAMAAVFSSPPELRLAKLVATWMDAATDQPTASALKAVLTALDGLVPDAGIGWALRQAENARPLGAECLHNGGFEEPNPVGLAETAALLAALSFPSHWTPIVQRGSQPAFIRWGGEARTGVFSVRADHADYDWISQRLAARPSSVYRFAVFMKGHLSPGASVSLQAQWTDAEGETIKGSPHTLDITGAGEWTDWTELAGFSPAPPGAAFLEVQIVAEGCGRNDWILFDDASLRLL